MERVVADGKHLRLGPAPYRVKGVTYGHFAPRGDGCVFPETPQVDRDLTAIAEHGFTVVRTYSVPPPELLDTARALGLRLLVGLRYDDWRMHAAASRGSRRQVRRDGVPAVREALDRLAGRPEVLAVSVGNEVPSDIVRLYGRTAVEDTLAELVAEVHAGDPDLLATYTGYPTSEYLRVEGQDLTTFNVFLERADRLAPYLRHLQRVSEDRPLVLTELGLVAEVHGEAEQADDRAEHVPGCNLAVRRSALEGIGGFDVGYTTAGDDVDVCWRLMDLGGRIGFVPAAQVHHHRRDTVRGYLRQRRGYGRAERMLSGQHRRRFKRLGAARWSGFVYGGPRILPTLLRPVVYHGPMGSAPFQTELRDRSAAASMWASALIPLAVAPGLLTAPLALLDPACLVVPALAAALLATYAVCIAAAVHPGPGERSPWRLRSLLRCRLRTAVRWEWDPVVRRSWTISGIGVSALAATAVLLLVDPGVGALAVGALLVTAAVETAVLLRLTGGALDRTTAELRSRS